MWLTAVIVALMETYKDSTGVDGGAVADAIRKARQWLDVQGKGGAEALKEASKLK